MHFDRVQLRRPDAQPPARTADGKPRPQPPHPPRPPTGWVQPRLFDARRDYTRFDEAPPRRPQQPLAGRARYLARPRGEARGWQRGRRVRRPPGADHPAVRHKPTATRSGTPRCSRVHRPRDSAPGAPPRSSRRSACSAMTASRPSRPGWSATSTAWPPASAPTSRHWLRTLRHGGPRSRPRAPHRLDPHARVRPGAAGLVGPLRPPARGHPRRHPRSRRGLPATPLQRPGRAPVPVPFCKKNRTIFRDPAGHPGRRAPPGDHPAAEPGRDRPGRRGRRASRRPAASWRSPRCTPPASRRSARSSSMTSTSATGGSPSAAGPARWTTSPARSSSTGSATGATAGPIPPTPT